MLKHLLENKKTQKMLIICQNNWRDVERPLSCDAFAIARFLVQYLGLVSVVGLGLVLVVFFCCSFLVVIYVKSARLQSSVVILNGSMDPCLHCSHGAASSNPTQVTAVF